MSLEFPLLIYIKWDELIGILRAVLNFFEKQLFHPYSNIFIENVNSNIFKYMTAFIIINFNLILQMPSVLSIMEHKTGKHYVYI